MTTSSVNAQSWSVRQRSVFRFRRQFIRDFLLQTLAFRLLLEVTVENLDFIPASGPTVLMINHVTAIDPIVALGVTRPRFIVPMSKIENLRHPVVGILARSWGAYPVKRGVVDRAALDITIELLRLGELVLIAPEGTRNPALIRARNGLTYVALRANPVIVPMALYNMETWLQDLLRPWRRTPAHVTLGRPFRLRKAGQPDITRQETRQITDEMMYQLAALLPEHNRGYYADLSRQTTDHLKFVE